MEPRRLEAEPLRDSILAVAGELNPERGGPGVYPRLSQEAVSTSIMEQWGTSPVSEGKRRSIYVFQRRSLMLPLVEAFDGAGMGTTCPRRAVTTIAPQALALLNGQFAREEAEAFARRLVASAQRDLAAEIDRGYRLALVRPPTAAEVRSARAFLTAQRARYAAAGRPGGAARLAALADFCLALINCNEFAYVD
jgi:hypothetical protein